MTLSVFIGYNEDCFKNACYSQLFEAKSRTNLSQTTTAVTDYTELETHMKEATARFDAVMGSTEGDDALVQNVPDQYLEPVSLSFVEPDYSR